MSRGQIARWALHETDNKVVTECAAICAYLAEARQALCEG